jgi:hypothetical protein
MTRVDEGALEATHATTRMEDSGRLGELVRARAKRRVSRDIMSRLGYAHFPEATVPGTTSKMSWGTIAATPLGVFFPPKERLIQTTRCTSHSRSSSLSNKVIRGHLGVVDSLLENGHGPLLLSPQPHPLVLT